MKTTLLFFSAFFAIWCTHAQKTKKTNHSANQSLSQPASRPIPLQPDNWIFNEGKLTFLDYKGVKAMKLLAGSGEVVLKEVVFKDGVITYDIIPVAPPSQSIFFHRQSNKEQEIFYLRSRINKPYSNDAVQYAPVVDGVNLWDLYDRFQAPALIKENEWNHIKLVISGWRMKVYVNDMKKPALDIPRLEGNFSSGAIAFDGQSYIANLVITPGHPEKLDSAEAPDLTNHDANYLRLWQVSEPVRLDKGNEPFNENLPPASSFTDSISAERAGLINLTRKFGKSPQRRIVWVKTKLRAAKAHDNFLKLGFSDEVWVFVNGKMLFTDKNLYIQNMRKYPDGRISIHNASFALPLRAGENELIIGVANDFYGWGIIARLEHLEGILF